MYHHKKILTSMLLALSLAPVVSLANDCGEVPTAPELIDGATASMEQLVATSQSVKAFIADADAYLDCNEAFVKSDAFKSLGADEKQQALDLNSGLLESRNKIGESFNEEVAAYKAANPQ